MPNQIVGRGEEYGVLHFLISQPEGIVSFLSQSSHVENPEELVILGAVYVNDLRIVKVEFLLNVGDRLRVHTEPRRFEKPPDLRDRIVFENKDYMVVNKPTGVPVNALTENRLENLISFYKEELKHELYITHRLDIETSGLLILAKSKESQSQINRMIREKAIRRTYYAWVEKPLYPGEYIHFMEPSQRAPKVMSSFPKEDWLQCSLNLVKCEPVSKSEIAEFAGDHVEIGSIYRLEIELLTGRPQQIRAQLSALGVPILGDTIYGSQVSSRTGRRAICLQATALQVADQLIKL